MGQNEAWRLKNGRKDTEVHMPKRDYIEKNALKFAAQLQMFNAGIGQALGIEGAQHTAPDLTTIQPVIELKLDGGRVEVDWNWGGQSQFLDMIELRVDRGDGRGPVLLAHDTTPGYVDTAPFPAAPVVWTYTGIYIVNDARVGRHSNPASITVGG